jgi:hydroxyacyl-ACP dehydratase HTD2-like protein with hotdog domain
MTGQVYFEDVETGYLTPLLTVSVSETQMFFFSAATYNGHRIHYDKQWARDVEGYDNVLVQGPLQAALLSRSLTDWIGGAGRLVAFGVQNRAIAYPASNSPSAVWSPASVPRIWLIWTSSAAAATTY